MAYIKESNLTTWIDQIICHIYGDPYIGAQPGDVINDEVDISAAAIANIQIFQLASRTNYLKNVVEDIQSQFVTTKVANKILRLDSNSKFIADIQNELIETKQLIITDINNTSEIYDLKTNQLRSNQYGFIKSDDTIINLIDEVTNELILKCNAETATQLKTPVTITNSTDSNILINPVLFDGSNDLELDITLKPQTPDKFGSGVIPLSGGEVYYAIELTEDARIAKAWKNINGSVIGQDAEHRLVSDDQIDIWNNKIDATFIPASLYGNETLLNEQGNGSLLKFETSRNIAPYDSLKTTYFGIHRNPTKPEIDHGFKFETFENNTGVNKHLYVGFLNEYFELYGTHNFNPSEYATLNSPNLTGVPTVPTAQVSLNSGSLQIANLSYVFQAINKADEDKWLKYQNTIDFLLHNKRNMYNHNDCMIFQNIFDAVTSNYIAKGVVAPGFDNTTYSTAKWHNENMIKFGTGATHDFKVRIPEEYDTIWLRVTNDRWNIYGVKHGTNTPDPITFDATKSNTLARYAAGYRNLVNISPDGGLPDSDTYFHKWIPIPIDKTVNTTVVNINGTQCREVIIYSGYYNYNSYNITPGDNWISGLGFSKNPFRHTALSAYDIAFGLNNTFKLNWHSENWNRDNLAYIKAGTVGTFKIPVIGREIIKPDTSDLDLVVGRNDRLLYIIGHNDNWQNGSHRSITINGIPIERFRTTYHNPFSRHYNSALYSNYMAARIPSSIIETCNGFIEVSIDCTKSAEHFYFREIGTHDFIP